MAFSGVTSVKFTAAPERIKQRRGESERLTPTLVCTAGQLLQKTYPGTSQNTPLTGWS